MNLLNQLTIKNLKLNKKRTIVTIIGIMLSVALITAVASMYASGIKSLIGFEINEQGNFHVGFYEVPIDDLNQFRENRNIEKVDITKNIGYAKIGSKNQKKPFVFLKAFTKDSLDNLSVKLIEGRLPENDSEVLIPTHLKTDGRVDLKVGSTINLDVGQRYDKEGKLLNQTNSYQGKDEHLQNSFTKTYTIVGKIERPAMSIERYTAPGYTFITYLDENKVNGNVDVFARFNKDGLKQVYETTANILGINPTLYKKAATNIELSEEEKQELQKQLESAKYEITANGYLIDLETNPLTSSSISGLGFTIAVVIGIIVVTSVFCIKNSFDISITEKTKQYGMLRSIGATKKQIRKNVYFEATVLGLIGIPLGLLLGFLASFILVIVSNHFLTIALNNIKLVFVFSIPAALISILLGIVTIYLSALRSASRASKVSPIDSIRNSANIKINPKKIKSPKYIKKLFGIGGEISYKNLKRNKKKYRTTVVSLTVSVFVFIALYGFMSMAFQEIDNELNLSDYNISLSSKEITEKTYNKFIDTTTLENIEDSTILRTSDLKFKENHYSKEYKEFTNLQIDPEVDNYTSILAIGKDQYNKYIKSLGLEYDSIKNKAILIDEEDIKNNDKKQTKHIRVYDFKKGDIIEASVTSTEKEINLEIGAITETVPFGLKNMGKRYIIISDEKFDEIAKSKSLTIYYKSNNANQLQDDIDELLKDEIYNINNIAESVAIESSFFILIGIFLYGFIIVISLIGITNIFNTITTNMELRKQEFAMLKSVGMTTKEFNRMIRLESIFTGLKSLIFGIPIGVGLSYLIYHSLAETSTTSFKLPIFAIIISIVVVFLLIFLIMKYSMSKINKQNTIETIKNENI